MPAPRPLEALINTADPGWPLVETWLAAATNAAEVLPVDPDAAARTLYALQVTTRSAMGAIAYATGGILFDDGWLRLLGSSSPRMQDDLASWNGLSAPGDSAAIPRVLIVAHDVVGGVFALDGGGLGPGRGDVFYFAPDALAWQDIDTTYSGLVEWCCSGDLDGFYRSLRWPTWREDSARLSGDQGFMLYPPPWTTEGKDVAAATRGVVPMRELWALARSFRAQLDGDTLP